MIRLLIADDHQLIRTGIVAMLGGEPGVQIVGQAINGDELIAALAHTPADLVLMDFFMPLRDGYETTRYLAENYPQVKVLILSALEDEDFILRVLAVGASGYLLKNTSKEELIHAIRTVSAGGQYISTAVSLALLRQKEDLLTLTPPKPAGRLSPREMEVLQLIADGLTNAEIADKLFTSKRTVETHRKNILEKTGCNNTASLVRYAITQGLI